VHKEIITLPDLCSVFAAYRVVRSNNQYTATITLSITDYLIVRTSDQPLMVTCLSLEPQHRPIDPAASLFLDIAAGTPLNDPALTWTTPPKTKTLLIHQTCGMIWSQSCGCLGRKNASCKCPKWTLSIQLPIVWSLSNGWGIVKAWNRKLYNAIVNAQWYNKKLNM